MKLGKLNNHIIIVTGLSGAGRTTALKIFEDIGFEAVDNLPVFLLQSIIVCNNAYQRRLLEMVFYMQSPVSPVYIIDDKNDVEQLYNNIIRHPQFYGSGVSAYFPK